jgi:predicted anti-sigma-YlaC factor YlaD
MDGEAEPAPAEETDAHLETCASCRTWQVRAFAATRALRVRQAPAVPDLAAGILEQATPPVNTRGWWPRIALVCVAAAQVCLAVSQLVGVGTTADRAAHGGLPVAAHLFHEGIAWNLALGVGLLWAAFRSRVTSGLIPVAGTFVLVLTVYSTHDVITGAVPLGRVLTHGLVVVGLGLMIVINRWYSDPEPRGGARADGATDAVEEAATAVDDKPASPRRPQRRRWIRPTGRTRRVA